MELLLQRNWHTSARMEGDEVISEAVYCGTDRELTAKLIVEAATFRVIKAYWEVYRAPGVSLPQIFEIKELQGLIAYFGVGKEMSQKLAYLNDPLAVNLFSDAVTGVIQSETFIFTLRGFPNKEVYEENWQEIFSNNCRYYSNLDRVTIDWYSHLGYEVRSGILFNRIKTQTLFRKTEAGQDIYFLSGQVNDSFHGLAAETVLDERFTVKDIKGSLLRVPDDVCRESTAYLPDLIGKDITSITKKEIARLLGLGQGCTHLIDVMIDGAETVRLFVEER